MPTRSRLMVTGLVVLGLVAASCGGDDDSASTTTAATTAPETPETPETTDATETTDAPETTAAPETTTAPETTAAPDTTDAPGVTASGTITVFAAASLTDAFGDIADEFTAEHPDAEVVFNFAGSSALVAQINEGAPADVFASADLANMERLTDADNHATEPVTFTTNLAQIIVGAGNPHGIEAVEDLADPDLLVISCALEVPCGNYAAQILENAGVDVTFRSFEENVRAVTTKVSLGEADAGIVYMTDVMSVGDGAEGVDIPDDINIVAEYPIAITTEASNPDGGQAFIDFVLSDGGQAILDSYGFVAP